LELEKRPVKTFGFTLLGTKGRLKDRWTGNMENLSDRQAADAVRGRIDWKYVLGLPLTDPGFDHTVLSEFRSRLIAGRLKTCCLVFFWTAYGASDLSKQADARGRTQHMCLPQCAASTGLNV
jgi:transposase